MTSIEIHSDQIARWASVVMEWGYPRPVSQREVDYARWFTNGRAVVWFIEPLPDNVPAPYGFVPEGVLAVHGIADPRQRGRALTRETARELERLGAALGATKLYSLIPRETPNMPVKAMRRYLRRYGWLEDEFGSYKLLGGG